MQRNITHSGLVSDPRRYQPLTADYLQDILHYDPETGILRWAKKTTRRVVVGAIAGSFTPEGYAQVRVFYKNYRAHRLIWFYMTGAWPAHEIDHINGHPGDNRWCNLREATRGQNSANRRMKRNYVLGYKGVWQHLTTQKYWATVRHNGKKTHSGPFDVPEDAHEEYKRLASEQHGPYARFE